MSLILLDFRPRQSDDLAMETAADIDETPAPAYEFGASVLIEKILEHQFLADLLRELWRRGERDIEVLRAEVDASGYDIVIGCNGVFRHIQLKSSHAKSAKPHVPINTALGRKPSGCIVWLIYDVRSLKTESYLWYGAAPGQPLPDLGTRIAKHTKANSQGIKALRPGIRLVRKSGFAKLGTIQALADGLFGGQV